MVHLRAAAGCELHGIYKRAGLLGSRMLLRPRWYLLLYLLQILYSTLYTLYSKLPSPLFVQTEQGVNVSVNVNLQCICIYTVHTHPCVLQSLQRSAAGAWPIPNYSTYRNCGGSGSETYRKKKPPSHTYRLNDIHTHIPTGSSYSTGP